MSSPLVIPAEPFSSEMRPSVVHLHGAVSMFVPELTNFLRILGVMRFLQTEWHRHERDRNAWEIERAEMKSRVGKLEGDGRTAKRLQETLGKHVKILENALRREREKVKKMQSSGDGTADTASESGKENLKASANRKCFQLSCDAVA